MIFEGLAAALEFRREPLIERQHELTHLTRLFVRAGLRCLEGQPFRIVTGNVSRLRLGIRPGATRVIDRSQVWLCRGAIRARGNALHLLTHRGEGGLGVFLLGHVEMVDLAEIEPHDLDARSRRTLRQHAQHLRLHLQIGFGARAICGDDRRRGPREVRDLHSADAVNRDALLGGDISLRKRHTSAEQAAKEKRAARAC